MCEWFVINHIYLFLYIFTNHFFLNTYIILLIYLYHTYVFINLSLLKKKKINQDVDQCVASRGTALYQLSSHIKKKKKICPPLPNEHQIHHWDPRCECTLHKYEFFLRSKTTRSSRSITILNANYRNQSFVSRLSSYYTIIIYYYNIIYCYKL